MCILHVCLSIRNVLRYAVIHDDDDDDDDFVICGRFATDVMFQPENGDRSDVPNYLVIVTDGNSDNETATWNEARRARAQDINIITVSNSHSVLIIYATADEAVAYMFYSGFFVFFCFFCFFPSAKKYETTVLGNG